MRVSHTVAICFLCSVSAVAQTASEPQPIGDLVSTDASVKGSVVLAAAGTGLLPGSAIEAGNSAASIKLRRGGMLRVCPKTQVTVNVALQMPTSPADANKSAGLMLSLGNGALETNYELPAQADTIVTPDFRIMLAGPADFHLAVSVDGHGNTCVRSLSGNSGAVLVSELLGAGTYQVKANESVLFPNGAIQNAAPATETCGCPEEEPARAVEVAQMPSANPTANTLAVGESSSAPTSQQVASSTQPHIEVEAPFVFQAVAPAPETAAVVSLRSQSVPDLPEPQVLQPPSKKSRSRAAPPPELAAENKPHKGFFARIGGFFASLFGGGHKTVNQ